MEKKTQELEILDEGRDETQELAPCCTGASARK